VVVMGGCSLLLLVIFIFFDSFETPNGKLDGLRTLIEQQQHTIDRLQISVDTLQIQLNVSSKMLVDSKATTLNSEVEFADIDFNNKTVVFNVGVFNEPTERRQADYLFLVDTNFWACDELAKKYWKDFGVFVYCFGMGDRVSVRPFYVYNRGASSSFVKMTELGLKYWPFPLESVQHIVMIPPRPLFQKLKQLNNTVVYYKSDVQGYDFTLLKNIGDLVQDFGCVEVECLVGEQYEGMENSCETQRNYLSERGFLVAHDPRQNFGNTLAINKKIVDPVKFIERYCAFENPRFILDVVARSHL